VPCLALCCFDLLLFVSEIRGYFGRTPWSQSKSGLIQLAVLCGLKTNKKKSKQWNLITVRSSPSRIKVASINTARNNAHFIYVPLLWGITVNIASEWVIRPLFYLNLVRHYRERQCFYCLIFLCEFLPWCQRSEVEWLLDMSLRVFDSISLSAW
jgi:hypothetical protein